MLKSLQKVMRRFSLMKILDQLNHSESACDFLVVLKNLDPVSLSNLGGRQKARIALVFKSVCVESREVVCV